MTDISAIGRIVSGLAAAAPSSQPKPLDGLKEAGMDFAATLQEGERAAVAGMTGAMPMQEAVGKILEAERSLQAAIAIRDKIVASYLEITRMQI
jgi:flagellar hook-basal body complex protein FliE